MTKLQKWFLITALWAVILASIFVFYWVKVRPAKIRQLCTKEAAEVCAEIKSSVSNMLEVNRAVYANCLKKYGVER